MSTVELSFPRYDLMMFGPRLDVRISAPALEIKEGAVVGLEYPPPLTVKALIDTGSSLTVVSPELAHSCKLRHTGFTDVTTVGGSGRYPEHAAAISFPGTKLPSLEITKVVASKLYKQPMACIIGRDILQAWLFLYDGPNSKISIRW